MLQVCLLVQWIFESMDVWTRFEMLSKWRQFKAQWIMGTRIRSRSGSSVIILYPRNRRLWRSSTENLRIRTAIMSTSLFVVPQYLVPTRPTYDIFWKIQIDRNILVNKGFRYCNCYNQTSKIAKDCSYCGLTCICSDKGLLVVCL